MPQLQLQVACTLCGAGCCVPQVACICVWVRAGCCVPQVACICVWVRAGCCVPQVACILCALNVVDSAQQTHAVVVNVLIECSCRPPPVLLYVIHTHSMHC